MNKKVILMGLIVLTVMSMLTGCLCHVNVNVSTPSDGVKKTDKNILQGSENDDTIVCEVIFTGKPKVLRGDDANNMYNLVRDAYDKGEIKDEYSEPLGESAEFSFKAGDMEFDHYSVYKGCIAYSAMGSPRVFSIINDAEYEKIIDALYEL